MLSCGSRYGTSTVSERGEGRTKLPGILVLAAVLLLTSLGIPTWIGWRLGAAVRRDFHARSADVLVRGGPTAVATGEFSRLILIVHQAVIDGLPLDEVRADFRDVELDVRDAFNGELVIHRIGGGQASLEATADDLQRYLVETKGIAGARVRLADGVVTVSGHVTVLAYQIDVTMRGRLAVAGGTKVVLRVETLSISGLSLPADAASALAATMNPLLTIDQLPVPLRLKDVTVRDGRVIVTAEPR